MTLVQRGSLCAVIMAVSLVCGEHVLAQVAAPGSHVRIETVNGGPQQEGTLVAMTNDTLSFHPGVSSALLTMPMDSVRTLFASGGPRSHPVRSGLIGAGIGVGALVVAVALADKIGGSNDGPPAAIGLYYFSVPAALLGFATGYIIGESHTSERWERIYDRSETASLLIGPAPHNGFTLGLSIPLDIDVQP